MSEVCDSQRIKPELVFCDFSSQTTNSRSNTIPSSPSWNSPKRVRAHSESPSEYSLNLSPTVTLRYSSQPRRMTNTVRASNKSAILAVGEELRQLLHAEEPPIIKDRRYHLKVYANCFVGNDMVDWLLRKGEVDSRAEAVAMMQKLLENEVIHHVCDDHEFKDEKLFYRFRKDDNTYEEPPDALIVAKGQRIYSRLRTDGSNLIQDRKYHLQNYKQSFIGRDFVDWLITRGEANTREEGVQLGREFLEAGVFRHVCDDHHFKDEYLFFRFKNDEPRQKTFGKRIGVNKGKRGNSTISVDDSQFENRHSGGSSESNENYTSVPSENDDDNYISMQSADDDPAYIQMRNSPDHVQNHDPSTLQPPSVNIPQTTRQNSSSVTIEELLDPNGKYTQHNINVVSDPVGYGFVIRGSHPVYVHTVDPSGPAAMAGLQVGEYLHFVNDQYVLDKSHTDVARIILMGSSTAYLVTFIDKDMVK